MASKKYTIILFYNSNNIHTPIVPDLAKAFNQLDYDTVPIDIGIDTFGQTLSSALKEKDLYFFWSLNGSGIDLRVDQEYLANVFDIPVFSCFKGQPYHFLSTLNLPLRKRIYAFPSPDEFPLLDTLSQPRPMLTSLLPGANIPEFFPEQDTRSYFLFTGTYRDPEAIRNLWKIKFPALSKLFNSLIDLLLVNPFQPYNIAIKQVFDAYGLLLSPALQAQFLVHLGQIERYVCYKLRRSFLTALQDIPITLAGPGLEIFVNRHPGSRYLPWPPPSDVPLLLQQAKALVTYPYILPDEPDWRMTASAYGTANILPPEDYFSQHFLPNKSYLPLLIRDENAGTSESLSKFFSQPETLATIGANARQKITSKHSWRTRAQEILDRVYMYYMLALS